MKFSYEARTPSGEIQTGNVEAKNSEAAIEILQRYNLIILNITEEPGGISLRREIKFFSRVKKQEIVIFSRQLSVLFDAQVPLLRALRTLADQAENPEFKDVITDVAEEVDAGTSLSQAIEKHPKVFSRFYISVVRAGEASGRLQEVLNYLADHEERNYDLNKKVQGALVYPAFIVFSIVAVAIVMMIFVIPQITLIFEESEVELPLITRVIVSISNFAQSFWWLIFLVVAASGFGLWYYVRTPQGKALWDKALLNLPIFKDLFQKIYLARFSENLSTLIKSGIPIIQSLTITSDVVGNTIYSQTIQEATEEVRRGGVISAVFKKNKYIPGLVVDMLSVGEESGKMDVILSKVATFYQKEVDNMVNNLTSLIQPILILILGAAAGLLVAAILLPIYNLSSSL